MTTQLSKQVQGQGVVPANVLNTYVQSCDTRAQLKAFTGQTGIQVYMRGYTAPNDGGQGNFFWSSSSTGPGDDTSVIVPYGATQGAWIRSPAPASVIIIGTSTATGGVPDGVLYIATDGTVAASSTLTFDPVNKVLHVGGLTSVTAGNLVDAATVHWDVNVAQIASLTLGGNRVMAAPTSLIPGTYTLYVTQPVSGGPWSLTFNSVFRFPGGTPPTLSIAPGAIDVFTFMCRDGVHLDGVLQRNFV